jgi:ferric-chelate reductase
MAPRYQADQVYALATVYFCCATIGLFMIIHILSRLSTPKSRSSNPVTRRAVAVFRYLSYKSYQARGFRWFTPTLGFLLLIAAGTVFFFGKLA